MTDTTLQAHTACPKSHSAATLLDAYQDGRITRDELLDHLLEWRKAAPAMPETADDVRNTFAEIGSALMNATLALEVAEELFHSSDKIDFDRAAGTLACAIVMMKGAEDIISERVGQ